MNTQATATMRDVLIEGVTERMANDSSIFFLTADFGAASLDRLRQSFPDRFVNVGIAEQDLVNVATGMALEGMTVFAYAIAPFVTMRPFEQIRTDIALQARHRQLNVNLVGVGAGLSYDVSGPTHHCLEDLSVMRTLPNIDIVSPSDSVLVERAVDYLIRQKRPKYIRLDGKLVAPLYQGRSDVSIESQFCELRKGRDLCFVSTGKMTHTALDAAALLANQGLDPGVIDLFLLRPLQEDLLLAALKPYRFVVTIEEGFKDKGGLDSLVLGILARHDSDIRFRSMGFGDEYVFTVGSREYLHKLSGLDSESVARYARDVTAGAQ